MGHSIAGEMRVNTTDPPPKDIVEITHLSLETPKSHCAHQAGSRRQRKGHCLDCNTEERGLLLCQRSGKEYG